MTNGVEDAQRIWGAVCEGQASTLIAGSGRFIVLCHSQSVGVKQNTAANRAPTLWAGVC